MRQRSGKLKGPAEKVVRDIRRATRKQYSAEEKISIVLSGLRGRVWQVASMRALTIALCLLPVSALS